MMKQSRTVGRLLLSLASLVIIIAALKSISQLLGPILLSLFVVLIVYPIMLWLERRGMARWIAYTLVVLGVIAVGTIFIIFLAVSLTELSITLPKYEELLDARLDGLQQWLASHNLRIEDVLELNWFNPQNIFQLLFYLVSILLETVANVGLTLLVFIYMLASAGNFWTHLRRELAADLPLLKRFSSFGQSIRIYLVIKSWLGVMTALFQVILMWILGIDFAVLWGVFSFLFNFVPNIGFYIGLIPPVIIAVIKLGITKTIILIFGYTLINNFFDVLIAPHYLGKGLDLSILVGFLGLIFWTWMLGPIGAFLALPLTVMVKKLLLESLPDTQLLASLMSSNSETDS
ncbi:MAG: AI-2E family transporter [Xenococcaceae cyanobacterium MO_188.B19]|nr:AI-2E family transporter [Xenococcaceae cyanobacterium MO_188.B19]